MLGVPACLQSTACCLVDDACLDDFNFGGKILCSVSRLLSLILNFIAEQSTEAVSEVNALIVSVLGGRSALLNGVSAKGGACWERPVCPGRFASALQPCFVAPTPWNNSSSEHN